jgi:hypothetical protein
MTNHEKKKIAGYCCFNLDQVHKGARTRSVHVNVLVRACVHDQSQVCGVLGSGCQGACVRAQYFACVRVFKTMMCPRYGHA